MAPASPSLSPRCTFILLTHVLIFLSSNAVAQSINRSEIDRQTLLSFKSGITNDPRGVLSSWGASFSFCRWSGVACGMAHPFRVVSLDLRSAQLSGQLSPCLASLTSLARIDLADNQLSGTIPADLFNSSSELVAVYLERNLFAGPIPDFYKMSALQILYLSENHLSGSIPPSLGNVSSLTSIFLGSNSLSGSIPETLSRIQNLSELSLRYNYLSGHVPAKLYNISSLIVLDLAQNNLFGRIPSGIGYSLPNLKKLSMSGNKFEGFIPASLSNASKLQGIDLSNNSLAGLVPSLGYLSDLDVLNLGNNYLKAGGWEFLVSLTNCTLLRMLAMNGNILSGILPRSVAIRSTNLQLLNFEKNQIVGPIPVAIRNLTGLVMLNLGQNQFVGTIPIEIGNLLNLQMINMGQNLLSGRIPHIIGNLPGLTIVNLSGNRFSGLIPSTVGNLSRLSNLHLDNNNLIGDIPASLGDCKQLVMLNLSFNSLNGSIPSELLNSTSLSLGLDLSNNYLTGSIPQQIGALINLILLDISVNKLSGQIPFSLGQCVVLSSLNLKRNMLNGSIPESFRYLKSIDQIDLSQNSLVGQIPEFFVSMTLLKQLDLSANYFEGPIPTGGIFQNNSAAILDGNARLCASATTTLFGFPICPTTSPTERKKNARLLVIVIPPITIALFSFLCFMVTLLKRRQGHAAPCYKETMKKVSYGDIVKATNWFSPVNKISSSRTGSIYICRLEFDTDLVAIKLFHLEENGAHNSFLTECEVLRNTRHRNIVKAVTLCSTVDLENNEFKAIVFEFMANGSLDMWVHPKLHQNTPKRVLTLGQRLRIAMDVASALDYMHNQLTPPLIHCDLKPGNVLLDYDMTARVGDFGSARFLSSSSGSPEDLVGVGGTIGYIAPEYGMGYKVSTGCDVYGFGVLLLEMLTGRRPTDAMFTDGLSLHKLVSSAFPDRLGEVLDPRMPHEEQHACAALSMQCYVIPFVEVGLLCSKESPKDRPGMREVCARILSIKEAFFEL